MICFSNNIYNNKLIFFNIILLGNFLTLVFLFKNTSKKQKHTAYDNLFNYEYTNKCMNLDKVNSISQILKLIIEAKNVFYSCSLKIDDNETLKPLKPSCMYLYLTA